MTWGIKGEIREAIERAGEEIKIAERLKELSSLNHDRLNFYPLPSHQESSDQILGELVTEAQRIQPTEGNWETAHFWMFALEAIEETKEALDQLYRELWESLDLYYKSGEERRAAWKATQIDW